MGRWTLGYSDLSFASSLSFLLVPFVEWRMHLLVFAHGSPLSNICMLKVAVPVDANAYTSRSMLSECSVS
jgi:hypothetical protein